MKRILFMVVTGGAAAVALKRRLEPAPPSLLLPLDEELAFVEDAEPRVTAERPVEEQDTMEVDIVDVVDDLLEPDAPEPKR
jgi:hypothetical protein